jgi:NAD(P)-dependent dehydrogenase (short-subunit alcohol dehydrogenase family)
MVAQLCREHPEYEEHYKRLNLLHRLGEPEELCGAMLYLMSDAGSFTTAEDILVDAGQNEAN